MVWLKLSYHLHCLIHLPECCLSLVEETVHDLTAEVPVVVIVHLKNLFKGWDINAIAEHVDITSLLGGLAFS
jgi:hypothetical protein